MRSFAILPAAGLGTRMGQPKLLLPWSGGTVIEAVLRTWLASRVDRVMVVVRPGDEALKKLCRGERVEVVVPAVAPPEMKHSVAAGLDHVAAFHQPTERDVWLLAPADMPRFSSSTIDLLLAAHRPLDPAILVPCFAGRRGHPVLFPWALAAEVSRLPEDAGIQWLLQQHGWRPLDCPDPDVLEDLDTPEDYQRLRPPPA